MSLTPSPEVPALPQRDTPAADPGAALAPDLMFSDPALVYQQLREHWPGHGPCWLFAYASLIWRPDFEAVERRSAYLPGWHRALRLRSRVNRGTPQTPGLVFTLLAGGACKGVVYRLHPHRVERELERLWAREMPTGAYHARVLGCRTPQGPVPALAFTMSARHPGCVPRLLDHDLLHILRHAQGRYGSTLDYLHQTALALREEGVKDRETERQLRLAQLHGLLPALPPRPDVQQADALASQPRATGSSGETDKWPAG